MDFIWDLLELLFQAVPAFREGREHRKREQEEQEKQEHLKNCLNRDYKKSPYYRQMWFARSVDEFHAPFESDHQKAVLRDTVGLPEETDIDEALAIGRREWAEFIRKHPEFYQQ